MNNKCLTEGKIEGKEGKEGQEGSEGKRGQEGKLGQEGKQETTKTPTQMYSAIQTGQNIGMQTLDQNLRGLLAQGLVSKEEAKKKAAHPDQL